MPSIIDPLKTEWRTSASIGNDGENNATWSALWKPIIERARWAPSGDNGQPWRIRPGNDCSQLGLVNDENQPLGFLDCRGEATRLAIGGFVENLRLAASLDGNQVFIEKVTDISPNRFEVAIRLESRFLSTSDPLAEFITKRHSNRKNQSTSKLSNRNMTELLGAAANDKGIQTRLISDRAAIGRIAEAVAKADHVRFLHAQCHREFHDKVHWTIDESDVSPTGFSVDTFEINPLEKLALKLTADFKTLHIANRLAGIGRMAARAAKKQVIHSSCIGAITGKSTDDFDWLHVGASLQRIWLTATSLGLGFQVLAVAPLLTRRYRLEGAKNFQPWQAKKLCAVNKALFGEFGEEVAIMFRVGNAEPASARTGRLVWHELVDQSDTSSVA